MNRQTYTAHQAKYFAHFLTREGIKDVETVTQSISSARIDLNPHQVDAAIFALRSPLSKGVLLADEVGLGKTIEASLVLSQRWWEQRRNLLLIVPASLRKQWATELWEKFALPTVILDTRLLRAIDAGKDSDPIGLGTHVIITSYEGAAGIAGRLRSNAWDLVVFDEAHRLRNAHKGRGTSRAKTLREAFKGRHKLLLTATPMQNNIMELHGLVSFISDSYFGTEGSFRSEFGRRMDEETRRRLADRIRPICKRTLRRQVQDAGLINYTNRVPRTFDFTPDQPEQDLYDGVSAYLQNPETIALGNNGRQLVTVMLRKILGSSSFAISQTLEKMIRRLEDRLSVSDETLDDIDSFGQVAEDWREAGEGAEADAVESHPDDDIGATDTRKLKSEIAELKRYRKLAKSIGENAKGRALVDGLAPALDEIVRKGGNRKAVIFTESVRTQMYIRDLLERSGFAGQTVILNGANTDADSTAIYKAWLDRHKGTEVVSGAKSADMKAALVDAFRHDRSILIATESGAEGINLQFCSLLINYDLPWNPQRVEQRIGRCHRYGQKLDVTVINFLNRSNQAEARIHQLLESKFRLFEGIFGSSDEVLGAIESGVDIERRILDIVQTCRTNDEINAAFDLLQLDLSDEIDEARNNAREQLMTELDQRVADRLLAHDASVRQAIGGFKRALLALARAELPEVKFHADHPQRFDHDGHTWTSEWRDAEENGWRFFRLGDGSLADDLVERAKGRSLPSAALEFDYSGLDGNLSDVANLRGSSGWMRLVRLTLNTPARQWDEIICAALCDDGTSISPETAAALLRVPARSQVPLEAALPDDSLSEIVKSSQDALVSAAQDQLNDFLVEEEDRSRALREDIEKTYDKQIADISSEADRLSKQARRMSDPGARIELLRQVNKLDGQKADLHSQRFQRLSEQGKEMNKLLGIAADQLRLTPAAEELFTIRWSLV